MKDPYATPRAVRIPDDEWSALGDAARAGGTNRTALLRAFLAWYVRRPGARLPARPGSRISA